MSDTFVGLGRADLVWVDTRSTARPVRMANCTPDAKALFTNPGYVLTQGTRTPLSADLIHCSR